MAGCGGRPFGLKGTISSVVTLEQVSGVERNVEAIRRTRERLEGNVAQ